MGSPQADHKRVRARGLTGCLWLAFIAALCLPRNGLARVQTPDDASSTKKADIVSQLREGTRAYAAGAFAEAQRYFRSVLELDPTHKSAGYLFARSIQAQFRPGSQAPENIAKAREAIAAYQRVLAQNPNHDEAHAAVVVIYAGLGEDQQQREWILARAKRESLSKEKRSQAFTVLAEKDRDCARAVTRIPAKTSATEGAPADPSHQRPADRPPLAAAKQCAMRGLEMAEEAIRLAPANDRAWAGKVELLQAQATLAEMENQGSQKAAYTRLAAEAQARLAALQEEKRKKAEALRSY